MTVSRQICLSLTLTALGPFMTMCLVSAAPGDTPAVETLTVDAGIKPYHKVSGVSGTINSIGSDTLNNLITLWAEGFRKQYPNVKIQVEGKGSSTAPPALIENTAQLGPMSRTMKSSEIDAFESKFGYPPTAYPVAVDALALFVNKDNPVAGLTIAEVDALFSKSRRQGHTTDLTRWGQLGQNGDWANAPVSLYGRNSASGTYGFFKDHALKNGDFKDQVKEQPGSASVVQGISEDRYGIGYSGIGYSTSGVKMVPLAAKAGQPYIEPTQANTKNGTYPLWRYLYIYVNQAPGKPLSPIVKEFLAYVYSKEGQSDVLRDGYFPVDAKLAEQQLGKIR
ncbi:MAG TPA: phosphate ABC transporter substrate-binding protein [Nitrospira sp.]|nr:phosphate ABC transporter substrate-binding protein [Nitrospira sp.]HMW84988.1 phosphate ABC transporter substrate-binding protein [Nitrospira sp.]HMZ95466.1 phosphate ABC transporter substrate-binding protein [Nitrospira sp.]HNE34219.1 phosphate ABC transporter substrate-binding protein [Nitrospira sp.]HNI20071.1 phosphate ABC transporter substrate-binding protein [Nitrospira sp.]